MHLAGALVLFAQASPARWCCCGSIAGALVLLREHRRRFGVVLGKLAGPRRRWRRSRYGKFWAEAGAAG